MAGRTTQITWQERKATAWLPDALAGRAFDLSAATARKSERAKASVRRADERLPGTWEPIARILLRTEGVASSDIEGLRAPIEDVVAAELTDQSSDVAAAWIADNLVVVSDAIRMAHGRPLSVAALHRWHTRLMRHSSSPPQLIGRFRDRQGWIGGISPLDAVYVPPPAGHLRSLMTDLVAFANRSGLDPVVQAAVLHAQFETIHPYGDGNGRLGRVLVSWLLARRLEVSMPPPVSVLIARDPGGYLSGLYQFREGSVDAYIGWFAEVVGRAGDASVVLGDRVRLLLADWDDRLASMRADATARRLVGVLPEHPAITATVAADRLGVSDRSARTALAALAGQSIVVPVSPPRGSPGRPQSWWIARELLDLVGQWSS